MAEQEEKRKQKEEKSKQEQKRNNKQKLPAAYKQTPSPSMDTSSGINMTEDDLEELIEEGF